MRTIDEIEMMVEDSNDNSNLPSKSLKEAAIFGLQTMIEKYGHSSNEVREVEQYIESK